MRSDVVEARLPSVFSISPAFCFSVPTMRPESPLRLFSISLVFCFRVAATPSERPLSVRSASCAPARILSEVDVASAPSVPSISAEFCLSALTSPN
jgi:hypothetical protein